MSNGDCRFRGRIFYPILLTGTSMHYHNVVILLLERSDSISSNRDASPLLPGQIDESPSQIISKSKTFLQTLLHLYYLRHSFETVDTFIIHFLSFIAFISINAIKGRDPTPESDGLRSTALLCTKGLYDQGKSFYLARIVFQLVRDSSSPSDIETLKQLVRTEDPDRAEEQIRAEDVQSIYPVNIVSIDDDVEKQTLSILVQPYLELTVNAPGDASIVTV